MLKLVKSRKYSVINFKQLETQQKMNSEFLEPSILWKFRKTGAIHSEVLGVDRISNKIGIFMHFKMTWGHWAIYLWPYFQFKPNLNVRYIPQSLPKSPRPPEIRKSLQFGVVIGHIQKYIKLYSIWLGTVKSKKLIMTMPLRAAAAANLCDILL